MSNSMQSHFNVNDDDEKEEYAGQVTIDLGDAYASGPFSLGNLDSDTYIQFDAKNSVFGGAEWVSDADKLREEMDEFKKDITDRIEAIEDQMVIVRRDNALEEEFEELKEAWQAYYDMMDKLRTFKALKDSA